MKIGRKCLRLFFLSLMLILMPNCSNDISPISGNGQDVTNAKICGYVYTPNKLPAKGAVVRLKSLDYLPEIKSLGKRSAFGGFFACSTFTNKKGYYAFTGKDSVPVGKYIIVASDAEGNQALIWNSKNDSGQYYYYSDTMQSRLSNGFLSTPCTIEGSIHPPDNYSGGLVRVYGFENAVAIGLDGTFSLENMPEGQLCLNIQISVGTEKWDGGITVSAQGDSATVLDSLVGIFYNGNGNTAGVVPFVNSYSPAGENRLVEGNKGNLAKPGFVFYGWNTAADGSGIHYDAGDTLATDNRGLVLYAEWVVDKRSKLTVTKSGDGSVSGSGNVLNGIPQIITATHDNLNHLMVWRVTSGNAIIADSFADTTTVILEDGDAIVEGVFRPNGYLNPVGPGFTDLFFFLKTFDGGYIVAGNGSSNNVEKSLYLFKLNDETELEWERNYSDNGQFTGNKVQQTADGGFVILGSTHSDSTGKEEAFLLKTDASGIQSWVKVYGSSGDLNGCSVQQTRDNGFVIGGTTNSTGDGLINLYDTTNEIMVIRTDSTGTLIWEKTYGGSNVDTFQYVLQTIDGGYIIAGNTYSFSNGNDAIYLVKVDENGDTLWTTTIDGINIDGGGVFHIECQAMKKTDDGGFILVGGMKHSGNVFGLSLFLVKLDANGTIVWTNDYMTEGGRSDLRIGFASDSDIHEEYDNGFIVATTISPRTGGGVTDVLIKLDPEGKLLWKHVINLPFQGSSFRVQPSSSGGYFIAYEQYSPDFRGNITVVRTDEYGNVE